MEDWLFDDEWTDDELEFHEWFLYKVAEEFAECFFLSDKQVLPDAGEDYNLGYLEPEDWWPLVNQLDEMLDLEVIVDLANTLGALLYFPDLPTELLEAPLDFLSSVLQGDVPLAPSERRVSSRRQVKIALEVSRFLKEFPAPAQAAVRAWADVHRGLVRGFDLPELYAGDLEGLLSAGDLPPAVVGFGMMLSMTLMHWPERAEGVPLPPGFLEPDLYDEMLTQWENLPDSPTVTEEGDGVAEALFAQGQLAHALAELGTVEGLDPDDVEDGDVALAYSRLSRAILWLHNQCRDCPKREGIACQVATDWPERPVPLLDVSSEIANSGRIQGCIRM